MPDPIRVYINALKQSLAAVHAQLLTLEAHIAAAAAQHNTYLEELGLPPLP